MVDEEEAIVLRLDVAEGPAAPLALPQAQRAHPAHEYVAGLQAECSRRAARDSLRRVLRVLDLDPDRWDTIAWWRLRPEHTTAIRARLLSRYGIATARLALTMLRGVLRRCYVLQYLDRDQLERLTSWERIRGGMANRGATGRMLSREEGTRLLAAAAQGGTFVGARDLAIVALALGAGLRRAEVAGLRLDHVSADARSLTFPGKGAKVRKVALSPHVGGILEAWLGQRDRFPLQSPMVFVTVAGGRVVDAGMSPWQVWARVRAASERAGVPIGTHDLRRTLISTMLDKTDAFTVAAYVGHSDPRTTMAYDRRPETAKAAAAQLAGEIIFSGFAGPAPAAQSRRPTPPAAAPVSPRRSAPRAAG